MRPIPVAFHIWFLEVHTYGIGLALTFWFALRYTERRLRKAGYPWHWVTGTFLWVIAAALIGARALHVLSDLGYYTQYPGQIPAIWQGGLSSFGGLLFAVPTAIVSARRRCPELPTLRFGDLMAPVLMASWAIGRLLGPQLMRAGGGHPTSAWFGMYYADQVGKRLPVPIFQAMEDATIFAILLLVERWLHNRTPVVVAPEAVTVPAPVGAPEAEPDSEVGEEGASPEAGPAPAHRLLPPAGLVLGVGMVLWGIERFLDEHLWLGEDGRVGSDLTQAAGVLLAVAGIVLLLTRYRAFRAWLAQGSPATEHDAAEEGHTGEDADAEGESERQPVGVPEFAGHGDPGPESGPEPDGPGADAPPSPD